MIISLIVAMDEKRGIGKNNQLPWHLPSDLKRFKTLTMGHHLIMGRKTYETIGRPLPGRQMVVISRQIDYQPVGCTVVNSLEEAVKLAEEAKDSEVFIIGGGQVFQQAMQIAEKIYLTTVHTDVHADVKFPVIDFDNWNSTSSESTPKGEQEQYSSEFKILLKKH